MRRRHGSSVPYKHGGIFGPFWSVLRPVVLNPKLAEARRNESRFRGFFFPVSTPLFGALGVKKKKNDPGRFGVPVDASSARFEVYEGCLDSMHVPKSLKNEPL